MKKKILLFLLLAGTATVLPAQNQDLPDMSQNLFNSPEPGKANAVFRFYYGDKKRVFLEFTRISMVNHLPDMDSLVRTAVMLLEPLKDSLKSDGMVRRVDIVMTDHLPKIRIVNHPELSNSYTVKDNELFQLKVNQDTVRIIGYAKTGYESSIIVNGEKQLKDLGGEFIITLLLDNIADITTLPPNTIAECLSVLKPKIQRFTESRIPNNSNWLLNYNASFNMATKTMFSPSNGRFINIREAAFQPVIGFSLQHVRGSFVPGFYAGLQLNSDNQFFKNSLRLFAELETNFSRDGNNKLTMNVNRFIYLQFFQTEKSKSEKMALCGNITFGYLFKRMGDLYEPHTFKLGLPILKSKHLSIEPQFTFNGFFKNFSPSIKFCLNF